MRLHVGALARRQRRAGRHKEGLIGEEWNPLDEDGLDLVPVPTAPGDVIFFDSFAPMRPSRT